VAGAALSSVAVSPGSLQFGDGIVGTSSAAQSVTISNRGSLALVIIAAALGEHGRRILHFDGQLRPSSGRQCLLSDGDNVLADDARSEERGRSCDERTVQPVCRPVGEWHRSRSLSHSNSLSFAEAVGIASPPQTITISNTGTAALTIGSVSLSGADAGMFAQTNSCVSPIPPAGSCTVSIVFDPNSAGSKSALVSITSNVAVNPGVTLSGLAGPPAPPATFPPYSAFDPRVILDIGVSALSPRNTWQTLPAGFALGFSALGMPIPIAPQISILSTRTSY
jgi:hypothetical protein